MRTYLENIHTYIFKYIAIFIVFLCFLIWSFSFLYSLTWIDKPYPGFLYYNNLVISQSVVDIENIDNTKQIHTHIDRIIAINGIKVATTGDVHKILSQYKLGTLIDFSILRNDQIFELPSRLTSFNLGNYLSIFGFSYFIGLLCIIAGTSIYFLRPAFEPSKIFFLLCCSAGIWSIGYFDSQSTYILNDISMLACFLTPAFIIYLGTIFPRNRLVTTKSILLISPFIITSIIFYLIHIYSQNNFESWAYLQKTILVYYILSCLLITTTSLLTLKNSINKLEKQRTQIVLIGILFGLILPLFTLVLSISTGINISWNLVLLLLLFYPISMSYSILKHKLFDLNVIIKKALVYGFLTGLLGGIIAIMIISFNLLLASYGGWRHPLFFIILSAFLAVALNPLQNKLQTFIDLVFFRKKFDYRKTVEEISSAMTSILNPYDINKKIVETIENTIFAQNIKIFLYNRNDNNYKLYTDQIDTPGKAGILNADNVLIKHLESHKNEMFLEDIYREDIYINKKEELESIFNEYDSSLFIPMLSKDKLIGVVSLGEKRSLLSYTSEDLELLRILANQSSIAIENALAFKLIEDYAKKLEDTNIELRETQAQLIQSEKMSAIGQLATGIAHEIRNPLNIIEGARYYLSHLLSDNDKTDSVNEYLEFIRQEVERTNNLIGNLLKFSKSELPEFDLVDINNTLDNTLILLKKQFSDNSVICIKDYQSDLPQIFGDANQLWQVFVNIIMNAIQAMPNGGDLTIKTYSDSEDNSIWISFKDTGVGMDKEIINKIFDPFFTKKDSGTGLGLSISYKIIEGHKGNFKVESEKGVGTDFQIHLPVNQDTELSMFETVSDKEVVGFIST